MSELATKLSWSHFTDFHAEGLAGVFPNDAERILAVIEDVNKREEAV